MTISLITSPNTDPQPLGSGDIERRGDGEFCPYPPGRSARHESLEALRYTVETMKDLIECIQNKWPPDRPQPPDLQAKLSFGAYAITRVRNGTIRRLAEAARS